MTEEHVTGNLRSSSIARHPGPYSGCMPTSGPQAAKKPSIRAQRSIGAGPSANNMLQATIYANKLKNQGRLWPLEFMQVSGCRSPPGHASEARRPGKSQHLSKLTLLLCAAIILGRLGTGEKEELHGEASGTNDHSSSTVWASSSPCDGRPEAQPHREVIRPPATGVCDMHIQLLPPRSGADGRPLKKTAIQRAIGRPLKKTDTAIQPRTVSQE